MAKTQGEKQAALLKVQQLELQLHQSQDELEEAIAANSLLSSELEQLKQEHQDCELIVQQFIEKHQQSNPINKLFKRK